LSLISVTNVNAKCSVVQQSSVERPLHHFLNSLYFVRVKGYVSWHLFGQIFLIF